MELLQDNLITTMFVLGLAMLAIEVLVLGFSTFVMFFIGLAAIATGILLFIGILPETLLNAFLSTAVLTAIFAAALWKPLKNMQQDTDNHKAQSDLIGLEFDLEGDLEPGKPHPYRFSGVDWQLKSSETINSGSRVKVTDVEVGVMHVVDTGAGSH